MHLVLVGGGHSHVEVLRRFGEQREPGVSLTLVSPDPATPYSGMLPGVVAGQYSAEEIHIALAPLAHRAGARFHRARVTGLDLGSGVLELDGEEDLAFDLVSLNVGASPSLDVPGAREHALPVKPIASFLARWDRLRQELRGRGGAARIAVVGGGAGGVELTLAAQRALVSPTDHESTRAPEFTLFTRDAEILPTLAPGARRRLLRVLDQRGVVVRGGQAVTAVGPSALTLADGSRPGADVVLWVTEAAGAPWFAAAGLACDRRGFVRVDASLRSVSHPHVFAAGDAASVDPHPREKAGVFAVRQGPALTENLRRAARGEPLLPFVPQSRYLALLNTADGRAVAARGRWSAEGAWVWRWKDRIDRRFLRRYVVEGQD